MLRTIAKRSAMFRKGRIGESYNIGGNSEKSNIEVVREI